jgi:phage shock protein A
MGLLNRLGRVFKANANAAVDQMEDPTTMLEQLVREMEEAIVASRQAVARAMALHKKNEELYEKNRVEAEAWYKKAELAMSKGQEELAREALANHNNFKTNTETAKQTMLASGKQVETVKNRLKEQEAALQQRKTEKANLIARHELAKSSQEINNLMDFSSGASAMSSFDAMRDKVMALEAEVEISEELTGGTSANKFKELEAEAAAEDSLTLLKQQMQEKEQLRLAAEIEQQFAQLPMATNPLSSLPPVPKPAVTVDDLFDSDFFK